MRAAAAAAVAAFALPLAVAVLVLSIIGGVSAVPAAPAADTAPAGAIADGGTAAAAEALAARLAAGYGWTGQQVTCLDELWTRESGFRRDAINPASGAYGIAQALGHAPGATIEQNREGDNYPAAFAAANPPPWGDSDAAAQVSWGLGYIRSAYGTPCGAWAHEVSAGFY